MSFKSLSIIDDKGQRFKFFFSSRRRHTRLAGLVAINTTDVGGSDIVYLLSHCIRMLQHRGKAYWKMVVGKKAISGEGSVPSDDKISLLARKEKLSGKSAIGYLSKRSPQFQSMNTIQVVLDGFFV